MTLSLFLAVWMPALPPSQQALISSNHQPIPGFNFGLHMSMRSHGTGFIHPCPSDLTSVQITGFLYFLKLSNLPLCYTVYYLCSHWYMFRLTPDQELQVTWQYRQLFSRLVLFPLATYPNGIRQSLS